MSQPRPPSAVEIDGIAYPAWPERSAIEMFHADPQLALVRFDDGAAYVPALIALIAQTRGEPIAGGAFRHEMPEADPAMRLANARAWKLVSSLLSRPALTVAESYALRVPHARSLPPRQHPQGYASALMWLGGDGVYLHNGHRGSAPAPWPARGAPGDLVAHPSSMRPCVHEVVEAPVHLLVWDYARPE